MDAREMGVLLGVFKRIGHRIREAPRNTPEKSRRLVRAIIPECRPGEIKRIFKNVGDRHARVIAAGWRRIGKNQCSCWFAYPSAKING